MNIFTFVKDLDINYQKPDYCEGSCPIRTLVVVEAFMNQFSCLPMTCALILKASQFTTGVAVREYCISPLVKNVTKSQWEVRTMKWTRKTDQSCSCNIYCCFALILIIRLQQHLLCHFLYMHFLFHHLSSSSSPLPPSPSEMDGTKPSGIVGTEPSGMDGTKKNKVKCKKPLILSLYLDLITKKDV